MKMKKAALLLSAIIGGTALMNVDAQAAAYNGWDSSYGTWRFYENGRVGLAPSSGTLYTDY